MSRFGAIFSTIVFLVPVSSAQITDGGTQSVPGMISHLLGIELSNPYVLLGFTATFGIMWLSIYIIFKVGIKRFDSGYGSRSDKPLSDALGLDNKNSRNMLAVLTLLITLSTLGTGAFYGLIRGWQSLILLLFTFMLLAGLLFILIGGTGGIIGGTAYVVGKSSKATSKNLQRAMKDINEIRSEEQTVDELEDEIEDEEEDVRRRESRSSSISGSGGSSPGSSTGNSSEGSGSSGSRSGGSDSSDDDSGGDSRESSSRSGSRTGSSHTEAEVRDIVMKLEKAVQILEDIEGKLSEDLDTKSERINKYIEYLESFKKILESGESPYKEMREVFEELKNRGIDSSSSKDEIEAALKDINISGKVGRKGLRRYISELKNLEKNLRDLEAELELLKDVESLLEKLQEEVGAIKKEEDVLESLIKNLEDSKIKRKLIERLKDDKDELKNIEKKFRYLKKFSDKIREFFSVLDGIQEKFGNLEDIIEEVERFKDISKIGLESYTSYSEVDLLSFSYKDDKFIETGMRLSLPGSGENLLVDLDLKLLRGERDDYEDFKEPFESLLRDIGPVLSKEFKKKDDAIEKTGVGRVRQKRKLSDDDQSVKWMIVTIFRIIENLQNVENERKRDISLSEQIDSGNMYDSYLINSVYLGAVVQNAREVYSISMKRDNSGKKGRAITRGSIEEYINDCSVYLSSYRRNGYTEPLVVVDHVDETYGFLLQSGNRVDNIDEEKIRGIFLIE